MMIRFRLTIAGAVALLLVGCAGMTYAPVRYTNGLMTGSTGMTLYTFDKDTPYSGKSACNGQCATNWPPFAASSTDQPGGDWTIVVRDDGTRQWAYSGQPLYFWAKDKKPGDTTGDGVNNVWHAVRPPPQPLTGSMNC
jgi:predicted lipoprotein with Yx(FWY)xxD motif